MDLDVDTDLDFGPLRFGKATTDHGVGGVSSHQPSVSNRRGNLDRENCTWMIFAMPRWCAGPWQGVCRQCRDFEEVVADFVQTGA